jgi:MFS family permease
MRAEMNDARPTPPAGLRWTILVLLSLAMFGNYYAYDSIGPVASMLQRDLHFTDTQLGTLNGIYSLPNVIMVLIGGVIVDRFGARRAILWFSSICVLGALLTAVSGNFYVMATGRLLFGLGGESMIVAITTALGLWFAGSILGFAFGLNLSVARAGSYAADLSPSFAKPIYDLGWQAPLWLAFVLMAASLLAAAAYYFLDRRAERNYSLAHVKPSERIVWSDLWRFDRSYWYVVILCVTFYSVIMPFRSTFAIKYFQHAFKMSLEDASLMKSHVFFAAIFATPLFGWMVDRLGRRALFMMFGSLLLPLCFVLLGGTHLSLWWATVLFGISFSLVPAVMWPAVPLLVEERRLGTAYGLMTVLQNIGLTACNIGAGWINDHSNASAENPAGYLPMLWFFGLLSLTGFVFAVLLRLRETGPAARGLESPTAQIRH